MTMTETRIDDLRDGLVTGIRASNHRRARRQRALFATPLLVLVAAAGLILRSGDGKAAYALLERADGTVRVEVFPDFDDVDALQNDLADLGLQATVVHLRAHPSLEGVVEVVSHDNSASGAAEFDGGEFILDVATADGLIEILIYAATDSGDDYQASPSLFAPGQELGGLHCAYTDGGLTTAEFEAHARAAGISNFRWTTFGEVDEQTNSIDFNESGDRPEGIVSGAQLRSTDTADVFIDEKSAPAPAADSITMGDGTHYRPVPTCTPELAEPWE